MQILCLGQENYFSSNEMIFIYEVKFKLKLALNIKIH